MKLKSGTKRRDSHSLNRDNSGYSHDSEIFYS